ncbi:hypothetical protein LDENG_00238730%2C partial [Xyrichtys novacula]|uniref:Gypsy retrotransposon integrase-like protein 1 n=1 Tax=Xyrichtys novacula TaxID=13765 RepID=A0AAV1GSV6_XYRNO|nr:hypothetical protein LDENG_00238730%2C partial [Xyrichtys novacula]
MAERKEASWQLFSEELKHALTTLTQPLLPGYVDEANRTDNNGLQTVVNEVIDWVTEHPPKEKEIPKALARLACVMSVQIKRQDEAMGRAQEQIRAQMKEIDDLKKELGGTERALQQARDSLDERQAEPPSQHDQNPSLVTQISELHDTIEEKEAQLSDARSTIHEQLQELSRMKSNLDQSSTDARDWKAQFESKRVALEAEERHSANLKQILLETQRKFSLGQPQQDQSGRSSPSSQQTLPFPTFRPSRVPRGHSGRSSPDDTGRNSGHTLSPLPQPIPSGYRSLSYQPQSTPAARQAAYPTDRDLDKMARNITRFEPGRKDRPPSYSRRDGAHPRRDDTHRPYRPDNRGWRDRSDRYGPRRERNSERPYPQSQSAFSDEEMGTKAKSDPPQKGSGSKGGAKGESKSSDLTEEERKLLRQIIRRIQRKGDKKADLFSVAVAAVQDDTSEPNMMPFQQTEFQEDVCMSLQESVTPSPADTPADLEPQDNTSQETTSTSAVLVVQANSAEEPAEEDSSLIRLEPPFLQFLGNLTEKGIAQKFYVNTVLENELQHEALLDTAADITLMSSTLFNRLRNMVQQSNRDIKLQPCAMEIRPYSTDSTTLNTMTMLNISIGPMKIMHPVYVSPLESIPFLIGQDLLKRFEPLIDYRQLKIWAQVRRPLPIPATDKNRAQCYALTRELATSTPTSVSSPEQPYLTDDEPQPCSWPFDDSVIKRDTFLCKFDDTNGPDTPGPLITEGINLNENHVNDVILALWADRSAISRELYDALSRDDPNLQCVRKAFRFPLDSLPKATMTAEGVCALTVRWNKREMTHHFLVIPDLPYQVYMGSDILVRLAVQVDTINNILWSLTSVNEETLTPDVDNIISGQSIPEACQVANELDIVIPAMTTNVPIRLNLQRGQKLSHTQAFFQPSLLFLKLGLSTQATPLLELHSRFTHLLVQNTTPEDILIPKSTPLGWLISTSFHDFELRIPVIGKMPRSLMSDHSPEQVFHTLPSRAISLFPTVPLDHDTICQVDLSEDSQMILHTVQVLSVSSEPESAHTLSGVEPSIFPTGQTPEHDPDFDAKVEQLVAEADALNGEEEREKLRKLLHRYRASFAKDSLDCGLTSIHSIRIPTPPDAPPTFVRQYKIPLAAGLYQIHDSDKRVVAYASKTLLAPELKFSDCEKALLATVWAVKHFSNYLGGQKVIVETNHQPVTFLNSQRIRDGVVTNARVASWLMALQSFDIEVHYAQNRKTPLGMELAACQSCLTDSADTGSPTCDPEPPELSCHRYFDDNVCKDMITAYVDGCSYHHDTVLRAGVGVVWVNDEPCEPLSFNLGAQTSQYAEVAGILIVLQLAVEHKIHALTICTDSNYARLSFSCHLPLWKRNGFLTSNRKPVKHKDLFLACDFLTSNHDLQIYWKKVRGHSRIPGPDKMFNDQADSLAKQGALTGSNWHFEPSVFPLPPVPLVCAVTRAQSRAPPAPSDLVSATVAPAFSDSDLLVLQASDPAIAAMTQFLSGPPDSSMPPDLLDSIPGLRHLFRVRSSLRLVKGFLVYVSDALTSPALVVPRSHRGVMLTYAHDTPCAGHRGNKATLHALQQVAYWPHMQKDVADYIKGCLVCCQFQPANPLHRAPLQRRGISFPWSDLQIDWPGEASIATAYTTHQYMTDLHQHLKAMFAFTQEHLSKSAEGRKSYYDQKASQQELQVGDKVWYYLFTQPTGDKAPKSGRLARKFLPRWAGPYLITEKLSSVVYQIKIAKGNKEPTLKWVHRNQIKLHHNPMGLVGASSATLES